jgi:hypothetical protein
MSKLLPTTPCRAGEAPVAIMEWLGQVTVGNQQITLPSARAPLAAGLRITGTSDFGSFR